MASAPISKTTSVFVDSSVLIAAAISPKGSARELILRAIRGEFKLYLSPIVLEETQRNLARKAAAALPAFQLLQEALGAEVVVDPPRSAVLEVANSIEPKDAPIVAAAIYAQVDFLATYDQKHLLAHKERIKADFGLEVSTPDAIPAEV